MSILVTGAAGYIGSNVVAHLAETGNDVKGIDSLERSNNQNVQDLRKLFGIEVEQLNMLDVDKLRAYLQNNDIDVVFHIAAFKQVEESVKNPSIYYRNNLLSTLNLLDAMVEVQIPNLVFSSSGAVYGESAENVNEDSALLPINPYAITKVQCEQIIQSYTDTFNLRCVALRYFNPLGAGKDHCFGDSLEAHSANVMPMLMKAVLGKKQFTVFAGLDTPDTSAIRDYVHVKDVAEGHRCCLDWFKDQANTWDVFNIGTGSGTSVIELVNTFVQVNNIENFNYSLGQTRLGDLSRLVAEVDKSQKKLNFKSTLGMKEMCKDAWAASCK